MSKELDLPGFYNPKDVMRVAPPKYSEIAAIAREAALEQRLRPAAEDELQTGLLLIDCQLTFCHPDFELYVGGRSGTGGVDDIRRIVEFIYRNLNSISAIHCTLDTHTPNAIFFDLFFINRDGGHPTPMVSDLSAQALERGDWRVNPAVAQMLGVEYEYLSAYALHYTRQLEAAGKFRHTIWPYHAMQGSLGCALVPSLEAAVFYAAQARGADLNFEVKGTNPRTENYSVLRPEVMTGANGEVVEGKNTALIDTLLKYDRLIIAGEAKSHCVSWSVEDLLTEIRVRDASLAQRIYLLDDCASPVVVPGVVDFTDAADDAYARFEAAGMHRVLSTRPISSWL